MYRAIILTISIITSNAFAFTLPAARASFAERIIGDILNSRYASALAVADSVMKEDKEDPLASVLRLAVLGMRDVDFDGTLDSADFLASYKTASEQVKIYRMRNGASSYTCTLDGLVKAIHSTFYLRLRAFIPALQTGFDALRALREARELDPSNTEVNFFLGLYDYAKAELRKSLWWVLFWYPGDKADGIRQLEECSRTAFLTSSAAMLSLSDIYIKEKKPDRSQAIIKRLYTMYPGSRFVMWSQVKYLEDRKLYHEAAVVYDSLSRSYGGCPQGAYNRLVTMHQQAHMLFKAGIKTEADSIAATVIGACNDRRTRTIRNNMIKLQERIHGTRD
jgi:tetratricopeptide (TPR) repeat protein